jgi:hypothetical protein
VDSGGAGRQILKDPSILLKADDQHIELAFQELHQLRAGAVDFFFIQLIFAAGNRTASRFNTCC